MSAGQIPAQQVVGLDDAIAAAVSALPALVPLTTTVDGAPQLVWDADDQLVLTEAP